MSEIVVNEELLTKLTSDYAKKYNDLPNTHKQAIQWAYEQGRNNAIDEFASFLHKKAKENNGLRLSSETRSWTHPCIFDYVNEFREENNHE